MTAVNDSAAFFGQVAYVPEEDLEIPTGVKRDQWKRPLIITPDGEEVAYTRVSSMVGYIKSSYGLNTWQKRLIVRGMGQREDLAAMASALPAYTGNKEFDANVKAQLDEIMEAALETAAAYEGANWGTAIHAFTDPHPSGPVPERMRKDVASYEQVIEKTGIVCYATEVFVVNHELRCAGTLDGLYALPALNAGMVGDKKTGKQDLHSTTIQEAIYSHSKVYDPVTRTTGPDLAEFTRQQLGADIFDPTIGLYIHIPKGEGVTTLHPLNLQKGYEMALLCAQVREYQRDKSFAKQDAVDYLIGQRNVAVMEALDACTTVDEIRAVYQANAWRWSEKLDKLGQARHQELGGRA